MTAAPPAARPRSRAWRALRVAGVVLFAIVAVPFALMALLGGMDGSRR